MIDTPSQHWENDSPIQGDSGRHVRIFPRFNIRVDVNPVYGPRVTYHGGYKFDDIVKNHIRPTAILVNDWRISMCLEAECVV